MKFNVHMLAFNDKGTIREVDIPDGDYDSKDDILDAVFKYGQNDFQPQKITSVSVGDVVKYTGEFWLVAAVGFKQLTAEEFANLPGQLATENQKLYWNLTHADTETETETAGAGETADD